MRASDALATIDLLEKCNTLDEFEARDHRQNLADLTSEKVPFLEWEFEFEEVNYGNLNCEGELVGARIAYDKWWGCGGEYESGYENYRPGEPCFETSETEHQTRQTMLAEVREAIDGNCLDEYLRAEERRLKPTPLAGWIGHVGADRCLVTLMDGTQIDPRYDLANHSPDGFSWGYDGSGPAQLALAMLCTLTDDDKAQANYQTFKSKFLSTLDMESDFEMDLAVVRPWCREQGISC